MEAGLFLGLHRSFRPQRQVAAGPRGLGQRSRGGAGQQPWRGLAETSTAPWRQGRGLSPWLEDPKGHLLWLGETQQGCRGACSSRCMAALCSFSSGGEVCLRPGAQLFQDACTGVGRGQEAGRSGVCSGPHLPGWAVGLPRRAGVPLCTPLPGSAAGRAGSGPGLTSGMGWGRRPRSRC